MPLQEQNVVSQAGFQFRTVPPNQTAMLLSRNPTNSNGVMTGGDIGDRVQRLILNVMNPNTSNVTLIDGWEEVPIVLPNPNLPTGILQVEIGLYSRRGAWSIRTGTGVSGVVIGNFSGPTTSG